VFPLLHAAGYNISKIHKIPTVENPNLGTSSRIKKEKYFVANELLVFKIKEICTASSQRPLRATLKKATQYIF